MGACLISFSCIIVFLFLFLFSDEVLQVIQRRRHLHFRNFCLFLCVLCIFKRQRYAIEPAHIKKLSNSCTLFHIEDCFFNADSLEACKYVSDTVQNEHRVGESTHTEHGSSFELYKLIVKTQLYNKEFSFVKLQFDGKNIPTLIVDHEPN